MLVGFGSVTYAVHLLPIALDTSACTPIECDERASAPTYRTMRPPCLMSTHQTRWSLCMHLPSTSSEVLGRCMRRPCHIRPYSIRMRSPTPRLRGGAAHASTLRLATHSWVANRRVHTCILCCMVAIWHSYPGVQPGVHSKVMSIQPMLITLGPMPNLEQQRDLSPRARARARPRARMLFGGSKVMSIGFP